MRKLLSLAVILLTALSCQTEFKLPSFSVSSFAPTEGYAGDYVIIVGENFNLTASENIVRFGDVAAPVLEASSVQLRVKVPPTAKTDFISVTLNDQTLSFVNKFTVLKGTVTSIAPKIGRPGSYVILSGKGFDDNTKVLFGTTEATVISVGANTLVVAVPNLAESESEVTAVIGGSTLNVLESFEITHDTWTGRGALPGDSPRTNPVWFAIGSRIYYGLGSTNDVWEYSSETNEWARKNDFEEKPSAGAYETLQQQAAFVVDNKGYVITAEELWEYDPASDSWTEKNPPSPAPREYPVSFVINGMAYFGTGSGTNTFGDFWQYNASTDEWTSKADFAGGARASAIGFAIGSRGFAGGGLAPEDPRFFQYDVAQNAWTLKGVAPVISKAAHHAQFSVGDFGYFGDVNGKFYKYDPTPSAWSEMESVPDTAPGEVDYWGVAVGNKAFVRNNSQLWQMNLE